MNTRRALSIKALVRLIGCQNVLFHVNFFLFVMATNDVIGDQVRNLFKKGEKQKKIVFKKACIVQCASEFRKTTKKNVRICKIKSTRM